MGLKKAYVIVSRYQGVQIFEDYSFLISNGHNYFLPRFHIINIKHIYQSIQVQIFTLNEQISDGNHNANE